MVWPPEGEASSGTGSAGPAGAPGVPSIVTPEAVPLALETATVGSRGAAYLLDLLIIMAGLLVAGLAQAVLGGGGFVPGWLAIAILLVVAFALQFGYPIGFETLRRGRTPGKAVMGLRVVTVEGGPVGVRHATIRATVGLFELLGTLGLVAIVSSFVSRRGQRLGDLAAGTLVVRERRGGDVLQAEQFVPPPGLETYTERLDVSAIGPAEYATVRETLRRLPTLPADTRVRIAGQLADGLTPRVTPQPPAGVTAEQWLTCVAAAVQRRRPAVPPAAPASAGEGRRETGPPAPPVQEPARPERSDGGFAPPD